MNRSKIINQYQPQSGLKAKIRQYRTRLSFIAITVMVAGGAGVFVYDKITGSDNQSATGSVEAALTGQIPGWWYLEHFGTSTCESDACMDDADPDKDQLTNYQEYYYKTDPKDNDSNDNGNTDGQDVAFGYAPDKPGKMTFEQAGADDNIVGESLLFNTEIKQAISSMTDLSTLKLPEVSESSLTISTENSQDAFVAYMLEMDRISRKYYPEPGAFEGLNESIKAQNQNTLIQLKDMADKVSNEYKQVTVPSDMLDMHKYQVALWDLVPLVIVIPDNDSPLEAVYDESVNTWFDNAQAIIALNQKIDIELYKLRQKYEFKTQ